MITNNPFSTLAETVPSIAMQGFVLAMAALTLIGVLVDIMHKKNVKYFFENAKKAKKNAKIELTAGKRTAVILKTVAHDIATTSELGWGKRRLAHVLGMYGTIIFVKACANAKEEGIKVAIIKCRSSKPYLKIHFMGTNSSLKFNMVSSQQSG